MTQKRVGTSLLGAIAVVLGLWGALAGAAPAAKAPPAQQCDRMEDFVPASFPPSPTVDNKFFPLTPGLQLTTEGQSDITGKPLPHRVVFTVTDLTKVIDGVRAHVIYDVDYNQGTINEAELTFFAQDSTGTVWNLGEYPELYKKGSPAGAPDTWIAGIDGSQAGIQMPGNPHLGEPYYIQGDAPSVGFLDCAQTFQSNVNGVCVPFGCFDNVLITDEISPMDSSNAHQRKYYAPGAGLVQVGAVNDPEGETLVLVDRKILSPDEMNAVRDLALAAEARGMQSNKVYKQTTPSEQLPPAPAPAPGTAPTPPPAPLPVPPAPPKTRAARALSVSALSRRLTRTGRVRLAVQGRGGVTSSGFLDLFIAGTRKRVATARFAVGARKPVVVAPRLTRHARALLRTKRRLALVVKARDIQPTGLPVTGASRITLVRR